METILELIIVIFGYGVIKSICNIGEGKHLKRLSKENILRHILLIIGVSIICGRIEILIFLNSIFQ